MKLARSTALPAALAASLAGLYFALIDSGIDSRLLIALKGSPLVVLTVAAALAARDRSGWLIAAVMGSGAAGDMLLEVDLMTGAAAFALGHVAAMTLYLTNRRTPPLSFSQKAAASALLLSAVPLYAAADGAGGAGLALYASLLAAMAATAWLSRFPRYRTGVGAVLFLISDAFIFARLGGRIDPAAASMLIWPLYSAGQILIFIGVSQTLRSAARA